MEEDERVIDKNAEKLYNDAKTEADKKEVLQKQTQTAIEGLTVEVEKSTALLGTLAEDYAKLALSGSFSSQVSKAITLLELNIEKLQSNGSDPEMIAKLKKSLEAMQAKLTVLQAASKKAKEKSNFISVVKDKGTNLLRSIGVLPTQTT